jgi:hypothetical protein
MSETTNPSSEEPQEAVQSTEALLERLDALHSEFARRNWWANFGNIATVSVGGLAVLLLLAYFTFGYSEIKQLTDSKMLYALLEQNLRNTKMPGSNRGVPTTLSQARRYMENEIERTSTRLAAQMSQQFLDRGPQIREQMETYALMQAEQVLDQGTQMTAQKFREIIKNNRGLLEASIHDLSENDELAEERLAELVAAMEAEMGADLKGQADEVLKAARYANQRLEGLSKGSNLNQEQKLERQFVMILHRMQLERDNPVLQGRAIAEESSSLE